MKIGYLRVSTDEQNHQRQIDSLETICDVLYTEVISAAGRKRPVFDAVIRKLKQGDTLVVHDLDRAFRSTIDALNHVEKLKKRGVKFHILSLNVDTNTPNGLLVYTIMAAFAEYERQCLSRRTKEGMKAAKKRGQRLGRPFKLSEEQVRYAYNEITAGHKTVKDIAQELGCKRITLMRALERLGK